MIIANITTFEGQCADAEHYYCHYEVNPWKTPSIYYSGASWGSEELNRVIDDQKEVDYFQKKDKFSGIRLGRKTNRFNTIEQIHEVLIKTFPDQDIVTYYESRIFKGMLYIVNGINLTYKEFGEVWVAVPTSVFKDLLPDFSEIKIKCGDCGHEYTMDEVSEVLEYNNREWVKFLHKRDMDDICCKYFALEWNVIY